MWRGANQRNIKYDTTVNRPIITGGYTDRGYEYYDTTINKRATWDGALWRDSNGTTI
jgi:hypothetical protein